MTKEKILIVDDSQSTINLLNILIKEYTQYETVVEKDYQVIIQSYTNTSYEFIIIEHNCKHSDELISHICSVNPQQKVILLSDSINCPIDCDSCLASLKFVRLLKPVDPKTVLFYLQKKHEFSCPNKHRFDAINTLDKLFDFINLNENHYFTEKTIQNCALIISSNFAGTLDFNELEKIRDNVNENYFTLDITDETIIIKEKKGCT